MIDTEKYEGHTVGDMTFSQAGEKLWFLGHPHIHRASDCMTMKKATLDLILDAPLLLAEVKRLRGLLLEIWKHANECSEEPAEMDETLSAIARALMKEDMR